MKPKVSTLGIKTYIKILIISSEPVPDLNILIIGKTGQIIRRFNPYLVNRFFGTGKHQHQDEEDTTDGYWFLYSVTHGDYVFIVNMMLLNWKSLIYDIKKGK
ncbi:MAG TPA: hypothetical protein DCR43_06705 [Bacteroidales bacterium]|nr:MAG: hypothetical protein A2X11_16180 [Bacteroidetes bacterium GWE2_42_24]OFY29191.1 MAG: hypothetical protein A2X09_05655 [Bacteroidetes bacterium GWF2_43_11]HAQ65525.1 hypothetical protein [Bacteroidales bacterium]HBZ66827.1 hypothetical protein [Bacteroidales bacterium]